MQMRDFIDTLFHPVTGWLIDTKKYLSELFVPAAQVLNLDNYLGYVSWLGPQWKSFIVTACMFAFIYGITFLIATNIGVFRKFKDMVKWW